MRKMWLSRIMTVLMATAVFKETAKTFKPKFPEIPVLNCYKGSAGLFLGKISGKHDLPGSTVTEKEEVEAVGPGCRGLGHGAVPESDELCGERSGYRLQRCRKVTVQKLQRAQCLSIRAAGDGRNCGVGNEGLCVWPGGAG